MLSIQGKSYKERMEIAPTHPILQITQEEMEKTRQIYNINKDVMLQDMDAIEEWCLKEDHLVEAMKYLHREILERLYLLANGSVESTKQNIEKFFTVRGMIAELALNRSIDEFDKVVENINFLPLPKLTEDLSRVIMVQFVTGKWDDFNFLSFVRYAFLVVDYMMHFDYNLTQTFLVDFKKFSMHDIIKVNPLAVKQAEILSTVCFGTGINGIHIINAPSFLDSVVSVVKRGLTNMTSKLFVHSTYEDLYKMIPRYIIPEDYGGDAASCPKLAEQWKNCLHSEEAKHIVENFNKVTSDESKRSSYKFNEEYLGMPGSFKQLSMMEYRMHFDYNTSETYVIDLKNFAMQYIVKINPMAVKKGEALAGVGFGTGINGIHIVNAPAFVESLISVFRGSLTYITKKLFIHNSYEDLHKMIPKNILPEDYGGTELSCMKLAEQWKDCLGSEEARSIVKNINKVYSDESKRSSFKFNEDYLGMPGSFKKLNVD